MLRAVLHSDSYLAVGRERADGFAESEMLAAAVPDARDLSAGQYLAVGSEDFYAADFAGHAGRKQGFKFKPRIKVHFLR